MTALAVTFAAVFPLDLTISNDHCSNFEEQPYVAASLNMKRDLSKDLSECQFYRFWVGRAHTCDCSKVKVLEIWCSGLLRRVERTEVGLILLDSHSSIEHVKKLFEDHKLYLQV